MEGPVMNVIVLPSAPVIQDLRNKNQNIPQYNLPGLIDTGCSNTCINGRIAQEMGLVPNEERVVYTPSGKSTQFTANPRKMN
jgi:predicted aspartyl protease